MCWLRNIPWTGTKMFYEKWRTVLYRWLSKVCLLFLTIQLYSSVFKRSCSCICTRCHIVIKQDEIILRANDSIYHLECFTCVFCNILLHPGDEFGLQNNLIYCRDHFLEQQSFNSHLMLDDSGYHTSPNETRQSKANEEHLLTLSPTTFSSSYYIERDNNQFNRAHHAKQKRLRTSFKNQQLRYMRSYFNLNHNPGEIFCLVLIQISLFLIRRERLEKSVGKNQFIKTCFTSLVSKRSREISSK